MPNHDVPVEIAGVWDILDWNTVSALAAGASGDPRDATGSSALPWIARRLIDASTKAVGREDEPLLHHIASAWIPYDPEAASTRQRAGDLAIRFGARPDRFIEYAAFKWSLFKRR